jgi:hypothetical protein
VWPLVILVVAAVTRLRRVRVSRRALGGILGGLTLVSLGYGIYRTTADPAAAYFITPTRAWEFGVGGVLAVVGGRATPGPRVSTGLTSLGIAAIALASVTFSDATPFPGVAALLPVLGAAAVIHAGCPSSASLPARALSVRPLQRVGDISYSIYLWHLPLLVLAPFVLNSNLTDQGRIVIVMLSVIAAWLTKVLIEDPVRRGPLLTTRGARWTFTAAACGTAVMLVVSLWGTSYVQAQISADNRATDRVVAHAPDCFGAASRDPERPCRNPQLRLRVIPTPVSARNRPNSPCTLAVGQPFNVCEFGVPARKATQTIALVGDSHASHWRAALEVVAQKNGWHGLSITRSGCPFSRTVKKLRNPLQGECIKWNRALPAWFARHRNVTAVFVVQDTGTRWVVPHGENPFAVQVSGFQRAWQSLPRSVRRIVVIRDTPKDLITTQGCIERALRSHRDAGEACKVPRSRAIDPDSETAAATRARSARVKAVNLNNFFCGRRWCYPVIGGALVHKDDHHMTVVFATTLGPYLERALRRAFPALDAGTPAVTSAVSCEGTETCDGTGDGNSSRRAGADRRRAQG